MSNFGGRDLFWNSFTFDDNILHNNIMQAQYE